MPISRRSALSHAQDIKSAKNPVTFGKVPTGRFAVTGNVTIMEQRSNTPGQRIVPRQEEGESTGAAHNVVCNSREEAIEAFERARARFLAVNDWTKLSGRLGAAFQLTDAKGNKAVTLEIGHLIRIDLPGPGPLSGDGYDWVRVEDIQHEHDSIVDEEWIAFRVRPVPAPTNTSEEVAHFYKDTATSTFILRRMGSRLTAAEGGRNEVPNTGTSEAIDNLRNAALAKSASIGFAGIQWKTLMENILIDNKPS